MALDCVSAAINTLVPKEFSAKVVAQLMANGNKSEAKTIRHLNVVKQSVDPGGRGEGYIPQKRKASVNHVDDKKKKDSKKAKQVKVEPDFRGTACKQIGGKHSQTKSRVLGSLSLRGYHRRRGEQL